MVVRRNAASLSWSATVPAVMVDSEPYLVVCHVQVAPRMRGRARQWLLQARRLTLEFQSACYRHVISAPLTVLLPGY